MTSLGPEGLKGSAPLAVVPVGMEVPSPFEDQGVRLAPSKMASNDEVLEAAHGHRILHGVPTVRRGSGGLLAPVLCLAP